jgi:histidinol-phosphate aminotransferase
MAKPQSAALVRKPPFRQPPEPYWLGENMSHLIESRAAVREAMLRAMEAIAFNAYARPLRFEAPVTEEASMRSPRSAAHAASCKLDTMPVTTDRTWKWPWPFARQQDAQVIEIPTYDPTCNDRAFAVRFWCTTAAAAISPTAIRRRCRWRRRTRSSP